MRNRDRDRTGLGFLALAILLSACGSEPRPETPDPERFRRVEAAGPFSVAIPENYPACLSSAWIRRWMSSAGKDCGSVSPMACMDRFLSQTGSSTTPPAK